MVQVRGDDLRTAEDGALIVRRGSQADRALTELFRVDWKFRRRQAPAGRQIIHSLTLAEARKRYRRRIIYPMIWVVAILLVVILGVSIWAIMWRVLRPVREAALTAERLAARLNVSPRTLHRQLLEEGASLQQLKDEARRDRAIELLNRSDRPLKQLAEAVGFKNEKSFARAFKQWTGSSPGAFREQARAARLGPPRASD